MTNTRRLTVDERTAANMILVRIRNALTKKSSGDSNLLWAMRRYVYIRLQFDERGNPMQRRNLKRKKMAAQKGICPICGKQLPQKGAELDRLSAMKGYTEQNTRLVCHGCHREDQAKKKFA